MSRARTAQCALLYKGWSGVVEWQGERRRREGHEVNESVADVAVNGDCDAERKMAGDCTVSFPSTAHWVRSTHLRSHVKESSKSRSWTGSHDT